MIDTTLNKDGQPQIITGELYGKHFKVFADSMRKAAAEIGATIYIGGQIVVDGENSWNFVDRTWNLGFFKEVGNYADFYVIHDYFDNANVSSIFNSAKTKIKKSMDYINNINKNRNKAKKNICLPQYRTILSELNTILKPEQIDKLEKINKIIKTNNFFISHPLKTNS